MNFNNSYINVHIHRIPLCLRVPPAQFGPVGASGCECMPMTNT